MTTDYEVELKNKDCEMLDSINIAEKQKEFCLKEILEEQIYNKLVEMHKHNMFDEVRNVIEKYNIQVKELVGINGILE